jgi:hypothetical protein
MFPETEEERQRSIEWDHFISAIEDAGFSMVNFENNSGSGKIIFHKPHPVPRVNPVMLQSMGSRMNKWFGCHRGFFILAGK